MRRQIMRATPGAPVPEEEEVAPSPPDRYTDRLLKLIPAETVTLYLFLEGVVVSGLSDDQAQLQAWIWGMFGVVLVVNVVYLWRVSNVTDPIQYVILTIALAIWVFTIGGPFRYLSFYRPFMGSIALALFTFLAPAFYEGPALTQAPIGSDR